MVELPEHFSRGDAIEAEWFTEIVRRLRRLENTTFNPAHFTEIDVGNGRSVSLAEQAKQQLAPAIGIRYGYVRDASLASKPYKVLVQFVTSATTTSGETEIETWSNDGEPLVAGVPPRFLATDFLKIVRTVLTQTTPIVRLDKEGGKWRLTLEPRWSYKDRPPTGRIVRCLA